MAKKSKRGTMRVVFTIVNYLGNKLTKLADRIDFWLILREHEKEIRGKQFPKEWFEEE